MEALQILEPTETMAYIEHEITCPFCGSNMMGVSIEENYSYYKCGLCGNDWSVLGEMLL